jgi:hypothetical protein
MKPLKVFFCLFAMLLLASPVFAWPSVQRQVIRQRAPLFQRQVIQQRQRLFQRQVVVQQQAYPIVQRQVIKQQIVQPQVVQEYVVQPQVVQQYAVPQLQLKQKFQQQSGCYGGQCGQVLQQQSYGMW